VALLLKRRGIERVRPLAGGLSAWFDRGFPIEEAKATAKDLDKISSGAD
jgi:3-mercaptopyruvate sulfurtransferase SseA